LGGWRFRLTLGWAQQKHDIYITRTGLDKMQKFKIVKPSVPSVCFRSVGSVVKRDAKNAL
jgi:hypothetical protein